MIQDNIRTTCYWHTLHDGRIQYDVCPRYYRLHEGQQVLCFVRTNRDGRLVLIAYGRSGGFLHRPNRKKAVTPYTITERNLEDQEYCRNCGTACAGCFKSEHGTWGSRFQPVYMAGYAA